MKIRSVLEHEIESVFHIEKETFEPLNYPLFVLKQYFDLMPEYFLVAENKKGKIAGYVLGGLNLRKQIAWILSLATKNEFQNTGIGLHLTKNLIEKFVEKGYKCIRLTVHPKNYPALNLYKKLGFVQIKNIESYYGDNDPRLVLELNADKDYQIKN